MYTVVNCHLQSINFDLRLFTSFSCFFLIHHRCVGIFFYSNCFISLFFADDDLMLLFLLVEHNIFFRSHTPRIHANTRPTDEQATTTTTRTFWWWWWQRRHQMATTTTTTNARNFFFDSLYIYFLFHTAITLWASAQNEHTKIECTHTHIHSLAYSLTQSHVSEDKHKEFPIAIQFRVHTIHISLYVNVMM